MADKERNKFDVSKGNIVVLQTLVEMMEYDFWRNQLRKLVFDYKFGTDKEKKDGRR